MENDQLMNEEGEPPDEDDMELGELDLPTLSKAVKKGETKNIPLHQLDLLAELYSAISKDKQLPKQADTASQYQSRTQLRVKAQKRRDMPKIQSDTPKKEGNQIDS